MRLISCGVGSDICLNLSPLHCDINIYISFAIDLNLCFLTSNIDLQFTVILICYFTVRMKINKFKYNKAYIATNMHFFMVNRFAPILVRLTRRTAREALCP